MRLSELIDGIYTKPLPASCQDFEVSPFLAIRVRNKKMDYLWLCRDLNLMEKILSRMRWLKGRKLLLNRARQGSLKNVQDIPDNVCVLDVDDPKYFLHCIGQRFYGNPSDKIKSVGVTGTNGKTTVTYLIESIIHAAGKRCGVIGTVNYRIGDKIIPSKNTTPGFLDNQRYLAQLAGLGVDYCVMEASSHALDQGGLKALIFQREFLPI